MQILGSLCYVYSNRLSFGKVRQKEDVIWSFAPHDISMILSLIGHEHNIERKSFFELDNVTQPSPAPKFSYSKSEVSHPPVKVGTHTKEIMISLGLEEKFTELTTQQIISEG